MTRDQAEIDDVVATFFAAFASGPDLDARLDQLRGVLLPGAVVVRTCGQHQVYDVEAFIEPRRELLSSDRVSDFREWEVEGSTQVWGDVAQHWSHYAKEWVQSDTPVSGSGTKSIQLVRTDQGWRISAVAWDDVRS